MDIQAENIIPVTLARSQLGSLAEKVAGENYVILTKSGSPKAALVDIKYLNKLQAVIKKCYQKTFINSSLLPFTREFTNLEISKWLKEDALE